MSVVSIVSGSVSWYGRLNVMSDMILVIVMAVSVEWFVIVDIMIGISVSVLVSFSF